MPEIAGKHFTDENRGLEMQFSNGMRKEGYRQTFVVPSASGSYAPERITFGDRVEGRAWDSFQGVTASVDADGSVTGMVVELWLPRVWVDGDSATESGHRLDSDYSYSGQALDAATGAETFTLAGVQGAQIRVKSGGTGGTASISATAI